MNRLIQCIEWLQGKLERLQGKLERLQGKLERLQGKLERLQGKLERLQGKLERLDSIIANWKRTMKFHSSIALQEKIIDILKSNEAGLNLEQILEADGIAPREASVCATLRKLKESGAVQTTDKDKMKLTRKGIALYKSRRKYWSDHDKQK